MRNSPPTPPLLRSQNKFLSQSEVDSLLEKRAKDFDFSQFETDKFSYKLAGSQFGLDLAFIDNVESMEIDENKFCITFPFASGLRRDGVGDLLDVDGILLERHQKNPLILFDHAKQVALPIGQAQDSESGEYTVYIDSGLQTARVKSFFYNDRGNSLPLTVIAQDEPAPFSTNKSGRYEHALFCEQIFDLMAKRFIRGGSIGYQQVKSIPLDADYQQGIPPGLHLLVTKMLEASAVVMPANADTVCKSLSLPKIANRPPSGYLVKSLSPYIQPKKAQLGYEGKAGPGPSGLKKEETGPSEPPMDKSAAGGPPIGKQEDEGRTYDEKYNPENQITPHSIATEKDLDLVESTTQGNRKVPDFSKPHKENQDEINGSVNWLEEEPLELDHQNIRKLRSKYKSPHKPSKKSSIVETKSLSSKKKGGIVESVGNGIASVANAGTSLVNSVGEGMENSQKGIVTGVALSKLGMNVGGSNKNSGKGEKIGRSVGDKIADSITNKVGNKKLPSSDIPSDKACQILHDGEAHGHKLTEDQRGMFGAACHEKKVLIEKIKKLEGIETKGAKLRANERYIPDTLTKNPEGSSSRGGVQTPYNPDPDRLGSDSPGTAGNRANQFNFGKGKEENKHKGKEHESGSVSKQGTSQKDKKRAIQSKTAGSSYTPKKSFVQESKHIVKLKNGKYRLLSHKGRNLGTFDSHEAAAKHEGQVEWFKQHKKLPLPDEINRNQPGTIGGNAEIQHNLDKHSKRLKTNDRLVADNLVTQEQSEFPGDLNWLKDEQREGKEAFAGDLDWLTHESNEPRHKALDRRKHKEEKRTFVIYHSGKGEYLANDGKKVGFSKEALRFDTKEKAKKKKEESKLGDDWKIASIKTKKPKVSEREEDNSKTKSKKHKPQKPEIKKEEKDKSGGRCKPGQRADEVGCIPACPAGTKERSDKKVCMPAKSLSNQLNKSMAMSSLQNDSGGALVGAKCSCGGTCDKCKKNLSSGPLVNRKLGSKNMTDRRKKYRNTKGLVKTIRNGTPGTSVMYIRAKDFDAVNEMAKQGGLKCQHAGQMGHAGASWDPNGLIKLKIVGNNQDMVKDMAIAFGRKKSLPNSDEKNAYEEAKRKAGYSDPFGAKPLPTHADPRPQPSVPTPTPAQPAKPKLSVTRTQTAHPIGSPPLGNPRKSLQKGITDTITSAMGPGQEGNPVKPIADMVTGGMGKSSKSNQNPRKSLPKQGKKSASIDDGRGNLSLGNPLAFKPREVASFVQDLLRKGRSKEEAIKRVQEDFAGLVDWPEVLKIVTGFGKQSTG